MTYRLNSPPRDKDPIEARDAIAVQALSLLRFSGRVYLGDKFVAMATNIGHGFWLTCYDRIFIKPPDAKHIEARTMGRAEAPPAPISIDGMEVEWSVELPLRPLLLMKTPIPQLPPMTAAMADLTIQDYVKIWRIGYKRAFQYHNPPEIDEPAVISEGTTLGYDVDFGWFRGGADPLDLLNMRALNTHCNFDYPGRHDYGSPVVLQNGRLAAVLIGGDLGPESSHQGSIVPIELVLPFRDVWKARVERFKGEFRSKYNFSIHH